MTDGQDVRTTLSKMKGKTKAGRKTKHYPHARVFIQQGSG